MDYTLLFDIGIIIISATLLAYLARYFKQPLLPAYVLAGFIIGPFAFNLIKNTGSMLVLSELGIAFLLFGAGMEINLGKFRKIGMLSFLSGAIQVLLTALAAFLLVGLFGLGITESLYISIILAFSSTMVVVKILSDAKKIDTLHGRLMIGILVVQDILAIIAIPLLSSINSINAGFITEIFVSGLILVTAAIAVNKLALNRIIKSVAKSQELLFLTAISMCFLFMWLASAMNFSIAIGAFIAGLSLSVFHYNIEISGKVKIMRDFFATIFFVTLGMQLVPMEENIMLLIAIMLGVVLVIKPLIISLIYIGLSYNSHVSLKIGLGLGNVSEFSFILATVGLVSGHLTKEIFSAITTVIMGSIILTPYFMEKDDKIYSFFKSIYDKIPLKFRLSEKRMPESFFENMKDHYVLVGCDRMGRRILEGSDKKKIIVLDYNPDIIERLRSEKTKCIYGDANNETVLEKANLREAKMLLTTIPDDEIVINLITKAKEMNPKLLVIAKANTIDDALSYYEAGANLVILPEFIAGQKVSESLKNIDAKKMHATKKLHLHYLENELKKEDRYATLLKKLIKIREK